MLVRVQVRANMITLTPHCMYMCMYVYMSHTVTLGVADQTMTATPWLKKTAVHLVYVSTDGLLDLCCVLEYCKVSV